MGAGLAKLPVDLNSERIRSSAVQPSAREAHSAVALDEHRFLVFGGGGSSTAGAEQYNDLWVFDMRQKAWFPVDMKGPAPAPRTGQAAVLLNEGNLLVLGGCSITEGYLNDVHTLDTRNWTWSKANPTGQAPCPRDKLTACAMGERAFVFGGFGPSDDADAPAAEEVDDDQGDGISEVGSEWEEVSQAGEDEGAQGPESSGMSFTWFNDVHVLDTATMVWEKAATKGVAPSPRAAHSAFIVDKKMLVFGGRDAEGRQNDLWSLDLDSLEWKQEHKGDDSRSSVGDGTGASKAPAQACSTPAPAKRSFHSMTLLPSKEGRYSAAVCYGGVGANGEHLTGLEVLDCSTMQWASVGTLSGVWPSPQGSASITVMSRPDGSGYQLAIFGGSSSWGDGDPCFLNDLHLADIEPLLKHLQACE